MVTSPRMVRGRESSGDRRPQLPVGVMPVQAHRAVRVRHSCREVGETAARLLGRGSKLMPAAAAMMMRRALFALGRALVAITLVVTSCLSRRGKANFPLGGVRKSARPNHQDEHQRANQSFPASHQRGP